ncbi:MAG: ABC transporter ATP-binding protein [Pseudomonadota bacterium]
MSHHDALLAVQSLGKSYPPGVASAGRLKAFWNILLHGHTDAGKAVLQAIDFEVMPGESMAIVGANGAGKSTLLKVITGVLAPTTGSVVTHGSVAALLELGAGFEPEYTGMDNLRMNAAFLGLSRRQIDDRLDDILAFADIGDSIHEPIKHYSSGMIVRLGFAVVASVKPDLLITDEVLAVGDESFQKKCIRWIEQYLNEGGTLLMVSHNMYQVQKLCRKALWLDQGQCRASGDVFEVTQSYLAWHERNDARDQLEQQHHRSHAAYQVSHAVIAGQQADGPVTVNGGDPMRIGVTLRSPDGRPPVALVGIARADGTPIFGTATDHDNVRLERDDGEHYSIAINFPKLGLLPGGYVVRVCAMDPEGLRIHDTIELEFTVVGRSLALGMVDLPHQWQRNSSIVQ